MNPNIFKCLFVEEYTNSYPAVDSQTDSYGQPRRQWYRRGDLDALSRKAYNNDEKFFFAKHTDPDDIMSPMVECEPEVEYNLIRGLTKEEYEFVMTAIDNEAKRRGNIKTTIEEE